MKKYRTRRHSKTSKVRRLSKRRSKIYRKKRKKKRTKRVRKYTHLKGGGNECASNPCGQHGTCHDGVDSYFCECGQGYGGEHCDVDIDGEQEQARWVLWVCPICHNDNHPQATTCHSCQTPRVGQARADGPEAVQQYQGMSHVQLIRQCEDKRLNRRGTRDELITRLVEHDKM